MKIFVLLTLYIHLLITPFIQAGTKESDLRQVSISEALESPYQYQTVNVITGEYCENQADISLGGAIPLELKRYYTSQDPIAQGWHFNYPNILHAESSIPDDWLPTPLRCTFDAQNRLTGISTSPDGPSRISFRYTDGDNPLLEIETEENKRLSYAFTTYKTSRAIHPYVLTQVSNDEGWEVKYHYISHPRERGLLLNKREEPNGRFLITEYYDACANNVGGKIVTIPNPNSDPRIGKVKLQKAPVGVDETPIITNCFFYGPGYTEVYDALGNKTLYRYGKKQQLIAIEHYWDEETLYRKERIYWTAEGQMSSRAIEDGTGIIHLMHTYDYDAYGNIVKMTIWGNLSGTETSQIQAVFNGQPSDPGVEHYSTSFIYSDDGKHLLEEVEDNGRVTHYRYHADRLTAKLIGEKGRIHRRYFYAYDEQGIAVEEIEDDGSSRLKTDLADVTERHWTRIVPKAEEPGKGKPEIIENGYLDLDTWQEVLISRAELSYSSNGELIHKAIFDTDFNLVHENHYAYNGSGKLVYTADEQNNERTFTYDLHGNIVSRQEGKLKQLHTYDYANRLIKREEWEEGALRQSLSYQYDYLGNMTGSTDSNGNQTRYVYDPMGRLTTTILPAVLNVEGIKAHPTIIENYDIFNRVVKSADPKGCITETHYNARGKPTAVIHPDGSRETFEYYLDGSLKRKATPQGLAIDYERDLFSRVTKEVHLEQSGRVIGEKTFCYSSFRLLSETGIDGCTTVYAYDGAGRQIAVVKEGCRTETAYDASGQVESKKQWYGNGIDAYILTLLEKNGQGETLGMAVRNSQGETQRYHELPKQKSGDDRICEDLQHYNSLGQQVLKRVEINTEGEAIITIFDALNRPVSIERRSPLGTSLSIKEIFYDLSGNKEQETHHVLREGEKHSFYTTRWLWGPGNRLEKTTEGADTPLARATTYHYNQEGLLEEVVKPDHVSLFFTYDARGAVKRLQSSDQTIDYFYTYDQAGKMIEAADKISGALSRRGYDPLGQLISETLANGWTLNFNYDLMGRLTKMALPDQSEINWDYDAACLKSISRSDPNGNVLYTHTYSAFDLQGRLLEAQMIGGLGSIAYTYEEKGIAAISSPYWSQSLERGNDHRIESLITEDPSGQTASCFEYNDHDQIIEEIGLESHTFSYDSIGNVISKDGSPCVMDSLNQLLHTGTHAMRYDPNGQLVECWDEKNHFLFSYDALGRLLSIEKEKENAIAFTYDPFGRRLSKAVFGYNAHDGSYTQETFESYLWEGENEIGAVDQEGTIQQLRVLGLGLGAEIGAAVAIEIDQKLYAPIHDHRGNVSCLIDTESGLAVEWYRYTAYGSTCTYALSDNLVGNPWRFSSKRVDEEAGLVYFGKRYYMPEIGRWISKDPIGTPESINRYVFSLNQPLTRVDPYGLFSFQDIWENFSNFIGNTARTAYLTLNSLKNRLSFEDYIRPSVNKIAELILGKTLLNLAGFYQDRSESGVHGQGELSDKVRITLINGILNARVDYKLSLNLISKAHGGVNIHYFFDATNGWTNDLMRAFLSRMGYISPISYQLAEMWRQMIDEMGGIGEGGLIIHYAHSIGAAHTKNALRLLTEEERAMIRIYTFGAPTIISDPGLESVKNFVNYRDGVSLLDPIGFFAGLLGLSDTTVMVGSPWGVPFIEHTLNGGAYYDIINVLGQYFLRHYVGVDGC